jgi:hypothetical protein
MTPEELEVTIEITCTTPPGPEHGSLYLGIQRDEAIIETTPANSKRIVFKPTLRARRNADGSVNFLGPFAHGPKTERFIYLNWAEPNVKGQMAMFGRIKLHLNHINWTAVEKAAKASKPIRVKLALVNAKGGPVLASVRSDAARWEMP